MSSVNKVIILGNCGRDPEVRYLASGQAVANVSVATSTRRKDRQSGETIEETQWHRVTFYERLAEIAGEYVKKGDSIYVEGRIKYGTYTDKDGVEKNTTDIIATSLQLLGRRERDAGGQAPAQAPAQRQQPAQQNGYAAARGRQQPTAQAPAQRSAPSGFDDMDDDVPF